MTIKRFKISMFSSPFHREDWKPVLTINSIVYGLQYLFLVRIFFFISWQKSFQYHYYNPTNANNTIVKEKNPNIIYLVMCQNVFNFEVCKSQFDLEQLTKTYIERNFSVHQVNRHFQMLSTLKWEPSSHHLVCFLWFWPFRSLTLRILWTKRLLRCFRAIDGYLNRMLQSLCAGVTSVPCILIAA